MKYQTLLVDGPYLAHRSKGSPYILSAPSGLRATMIHSFMRSLYSVYKKFKPNQTIICWESHGTPSWRRTLNPTYKPKRGVDLRFVKQVKDVQILLYLLGLKQFNASQNEADDVIANLATENNNTLIFTVDKDMMQLVDDNVHVYSGKDKKIYTEKEVEEKFLVKPSQIPTLLAIIGDKADNIIGLEGYGIKKATKVIQRIKIIENIEEDDELYKYKQKLLDNKRLTLLNKNCVLSPIIESTTESIDSILDKYGLKKMKDDISKYKEMSGQGLYVNYL